MRAGSNNMYCLSGITINTSKFSQHLLDNQPTFEPMENDMGALYVCNKKRNHINTVEKDYIYTNPKNGTQINVRNTVTKNATIKF